MKIIVLSVATIIVQDVIINVIKHINVINRLIHIVAVVVEKTIIVIYVITIIMFVM